MRTCPVHGCPSKHIALVDFIRLKVLHIIKCEFYERLLCVCVYIYIYIYEHKRVSVCVSVCVCACMYMYVYIYIYIYIYIHIYYAHEHTHTRTHTQTNNTHTHTQHTHTHSQHSLMSRFYLSSSDAIYIHACMHACMHTHTQTTHTHTHITTSFDDRFCLLNHTYRNNEVSRSTVVSSLHECIGTEGVAEGRISTTLQQPFCSLHTCPPPKKNK